MPVCTACLWSSAWKHRESTHPLAIRDLLLRHWPTLCLGKNRSFPSSVLTTQEASFASAQQAYPTPGQEYCISSEQASRRVTCRTS
ncbi:hypothetical protein HIM_04378 [Hirsutella minnesotensis 3608]|uniref:Uncharacterized protein n=1 Tax=Hirsutella minnesotensis 3608 TaxID=1043627 RepID=A0A0F7ZLD9_9HYPO|nr:hypothetical protein HIM_04378 [Hirsutella minnesotensis 3608]